MTERDTSARRDVPARQDVRRDWRLDEVLALFDRPLNDLLFEAQSIHRRCHPANEVQVSTLLGIETGGCPEDCRYCPQSVHYETGVEAHGLLPVGQAAARKARAGRSTRCGGRLLTTPNPDFDTDVEMLDGLGLARQAAPRRRRRAAEPAEGGRP